MKWKVLSSEYIVKHPYFTARKDVCQMPDGKIVPSYFVVELPESVCAMAITLEGEVILVKQYRHPVGEILTELPGGFVDKDEDTKTAIARELLEETGYAFTQIDAVGKVAGNPGVLTGFTHLFLARGGKKVAGQSLDANEQIDIELIPVETVRAMLRENKFIQALHVSCLLYGFQKLEEDPK